jgi:transposase
VKRARWMRPYIGATVHVAAVGPARDPEPVRSFGTFNGDLHRLTD